jgi:hypothetical protein
MFGSCLIGVWKKLVVCEGRVVSPDDCYFQDWSVEEEFRALSDTTVSELVAQLYRCRSTPTGSEPEGESDQRVCIRPNSSSFLFLWLCKGDLTTKLLALIVERNTGTKHVLSSPDPGLEETLESMMVERKQLANLALEIAIAARLHRSLPLISPGSAASRIQAASPLCCCSTPACWRREHVRTAHRRCGTHAT